MSEESEESDAVWFVVKLERVVDRSDRWADRVCREAGADGV